MDNLNSNQADVKENKEQNCDAKEAGKALFSQIDSNRSDTLAIMKNSANAADNNPSVYSTLPPYLLDEMAKRNPNNGDILSTRAKTEELEQKGTNSTLDPRGAGNQDAAREVYDAKSSYNQPGTKARFEGEPPTGNKEV